MGDHQEQPQGRGGRDGLHLPPGFRFYPKDEEIITFYLIPKVNQRNFTCTAIGEVDFNRIEPWELPGKVKMGDKDWYFFYQKDRKYPTGTRINRATKGGYWKATGKDKEIYRAVAKEVMPLLVGMKKTLVFYKGRSPRGQKTDWVMHEFRLEGSGRVPYPTSSSTSTTSMESFTSDVDQWVVGRVFHKTTGMKRTPALSSYNLATTDDGTGQSSIPMPRPLPFPMLSDFMMDPMASYYSTMGTSSSLVPPAMSPLIGMGSIDLHMKNNLFGNPMAMVPPMSIYHGMGMGVVGDSGFMDALKSGPALMVSQKDTVMDPGQTNVAEISQMVSALVGASDFTDALKSEPSHMVSLKGTVMDRDQTNIAEISQMVSATPECVPTIDMDGIWKY